ncbi:glucose 1,6-bisphosphate synthase-like [Dendronephthya gigantea]|uniref:glucose 1,6-bisphosphate synthase-like n=1 Tax=Dendronephthya gigantea TaxID=151771 RepID=UPI00106C7B33|nr:glucose 1,6-bisphosphate synthase-like [Dendronephthya gigantea]
MDGNNSNAPSKEITGNAEIDKKIAEWLRLDKNEETIKEVKQLINDKNHNELYSRFKQRIAFGTAGLRAKMGAGFSLLNDLTVIQASQGLCRYLESMFPNVKKMGIVIGYDARHNSERLACLTAAVFLSQGIQVYLFSKIVPTPFVPYTVKKFNCAAGVMVTASHNPKEYNGYKVYLDNGAQIKSPHDKHISDCIEKNLEPWQSSWNTDLVKTSPQRTDPLNDVSKLYYEDLQQLCHYRDVMASSKLKITYTPVHGVGYEYAEMAFNAFGLHSFVPVVEQIDPDPEFSTVKYPNPEEGKSVLDLAVKTANENGSTLILANDPDADRLGAAEKQTNDSWKILSGNEIGTLLGWWLMECHKKSHPNDIPGEKVSMVATTVSSQILKTMAKAEGFHYDETLTGFKWIANRAVDFQKEGKVVLFSFEEAIGFMCGTNVLDKDGISACVVLAELACYLAQNGITLTQQLEYIFNKYGIHVTCNGYYLCYDVNMITKIFNDIRTVNNGEYPKTCGEYKIIGIRDLTTGYDSMQPDNKAILPVSSSSQMITFYFDNGCTATLRTSGTEPKIKYYSELIAKPNQGVSKEVCQATIKEVVKSIVQEFLKPEENNLTPMAD